jgi:PEGA domain
LTTLILLGFLAATTSPAGPVPSNKAVVFAGGDPRAGRIELKLSGALTRAGVDAVDLDARFPPVEVSAEDGEKLAKEGREAYDNLDTEAAVTKLAAAAQFFEANAAAARVEQLAEIFVFLGASHLQNGKKDDASIAFMRAVQTWPQVAPDAKLFGSDVQKAFDEARKMVAGNAKAKIHVTSEPSGGAATVQGKGSGETPIDAPVEVTPGKVAVFVTRPGYTDWGTFVDARPGQQVDVKAELKGMPALMSIRKRGAALLSAQVFGAAQLPADARALAQDAGGRYLVMALVADTVTVQVWDTKDGRRMKDVTFAASDEAGLTAAATAIGQWLAKPVEVAQASVKPSGLPGVLKEWWFWAAVGGGVVVAGTVTGIAIGASQPAAPSYSVVLE